MFYSIGTNEMSIRGALNVERNDGNSTLSIVLCALTISKVVLLTGVIAVQLRKNMLHCAYSLMRQGGKLGRDKDFELPSGFESLNA